MAEQNPLSGMPLAESLANNMNESLQWMSRMWSGAGASGADALRGAQAALAPGLPSMMMPTFDPQELDKRITDLRTVAHWLDMNRTLLQTTIQALEMQRNAIVAMQSMGHPPAAPGASAAAPAAPRSRSEAADAPIPAGQFDPSIWWGALNEQFVRVASAAIADGQTGAEAASSSAAPADPGAS